MLIDLLFKFQFQMDGHILVDWLRTMFCKRYKYRFPYTCNKQNTTELQGFYIAFRFALNNIILFRIFGIAYLEDPVLI